MAGIRRHLNVVNGVSVVVIVAALGGVAWAALPSGSVGTSQLKRGAVTSTKVKNGTLTGADVRESTLGQVPIAARTADSAYVMKRIAATSGASSAAAQAAAPAVTLASSGRVTVYSKCWFDTSGPTVFGGVFAKTSTNGSALYTDSGDQLTGGPFLDTTTLEDDREVMGQSTSVNSGSGTYTVGNVIDSTGDGLSFQTTVFVKHGTPAGGNGPVGAGNGCYIGGRFDDVAGN